MATPIPGRFAVRDMERVGPDLWMAKVECAFGETLSDHNVAQVCRITVRFNYTVGGTTEGLMEAAKAKAQEALADAAALLQRHSAAELIDDSLEGNRPRTPEEIEADIRSHLEAKDLGAG